MLQQADYGSSSSSSDSHPSSAAAECPLTFQNSCTTKVKPLLLSQQWKIENFVPVIKFALPGQCLRSNLFRDEMLPEAFWQLCLYPGGKRAENANHVSLFLKMSSTSPTREVRIKVEYRFYFLNENGTPLFSNVNVGEFHAKPPKGGHSWGLRNIPRQKVLNCVRSDGSLMVSCRIELIPDISRIRCIPSNESDLTIPRKMVCSEYFKRQEMALNDGIMADCTLECNGQMIQVFKAMFAHEEFLENKEARVILKDTDIDSVRMMVHFMYCGDVKFSSNVEGIMVLAERYQISELKEMCEQFLCSRVNKCNALEMYDLADMYNCCGLKDAVVCTIQKSKDFVLSTPAWESFKETNPRLMNELMERVVKSFLTMGRFDVGVVRYLSKDHFRTLISIEMGMKNHELVPLQLISSIAGIHRGGVARLLSDLLKHRLVIYERGKRADGYKLTNTGYDFLALKALCLHGVVGAVGNQIGVGKESDVFIGGDLELNDLVLKFHRLGRISFRKLKEKRDYHRWRKNCSWLYLSRLAASKEFAFLKALYEHKFPVPRPIDISRHTVVMGFIDGVTLCHVEDLYDELMSLIVRLGRYGLVHGDFNEFNVVLSKDGSPVLIDFPQMVSMDHPNAEFYFNRDVECVRFGFDSELFPKFGDVERKYNLDAAVEASGFSKEMEKDFDEAKAAESSLSDEASEAEDDRSNGYKSERDAQEGEVPKQKEKTRLDVWLQEARDQLEELNVRESSECLQETLKDDKLIQSEEPSQAVAGLTDSQRNKSGLSMGMKDEEEDDDLGNHNASIPHLPKSTYSTGSTISREVICKRIALEQRAKNKVKLRLKGKASAVQRGRKTNMAIIKEYDGWDL
ncbi:unnamed protein product [Enterobius vermicularis]|uniref:Serine/threonine-protein kinase RIO2 n=1 Tax=Enterobius vermicularis TaxID=51028 RepID=A0A0N4UZI3_ENTVE|nr:unnamed protein product [Enterobius vermicularis]